MLNEQYDIAVLEAQVRAIHDFADEMEAENPNGVGRFIAMEIRNRLDAAKPER